MSTPPLFQYLVNRSEILSFIDTRPIACESQNHVVPGLSPRSELKNDVNVAVVWSKTPEFYQINLYPGCDSVSHLLVFASGASTDLPAQFPMTLFASSIHSILLDLCYGHQAVESMGMFLGTRCLYSYFRDDFRSSLSRLPLSQLWSRVISILSILMRPLL